MQSKKKQESSSLVGDDRFSSVFRNPIFKPPKRKPRETVADARFKLDSKFAENGQWIACLCVC